MKKNQKGFNMVQKTIFKSKKIWLLNLILLMISLLLISFWYFYKKTPKSPSIDSEEMSSDEMEDMSSDEYNMEPKTVEEYQKALQEWKKGCSIKPGKRLTGQEIKKKLGNSDLTLYDMQGEEYFYFYKKGFFVDKWYFEYGRDLGTTFNNKDKIALDWLNSSPPPKTPENVTIECDIEGNYQINELDSNKKILKQTLYDSNDEIIKVTENK
ncbi:MAG: hypothetical protein U9532_03565 ['Conium maculatum' witches'-broom phytoplasma]|nr:hypothetical protein ['Conium maculatum' witches'-broom phytoplasma]